MTWWPANACASARSPEQILEELRYGRNDADQFLWLRRYHETELMRLGLRDILGLADFEQNLAELSALADACLQYALEVVMRKNKIKKTAVGHHRPRQTRRQRN